MRTNIITIIVAVSLSACGANPQEKPSFSEGVDSQRTNTGGFASASELTEALDLNW